ncbi:MAG TPA: hypothetical protein VGM06_26545 [Polyangiaceae bacterium]
MNKTSEGHAPPEPTPRADAVETMRQEIDRTRSDLGQTLTAIELKLDPTVLREKAVEEIQVVEDRVKAAVREQIEETKEKLKVELADAKETVKREVSDAIEHAKKAVRAATIGKVETMARRANETTVEARDTLLDTLWQNPLPTALAGVGLTWLFMNRRGASAPREPAMYGDSEWRRPRVTDGVGRTVHDARESASRVMHGVSDKAHDLASSAGQAVGHASDVAGRATHDAVDAAGHFAHDAADAAGRVAHQVSEGASHLAHEASELGSQAVYATREQAQRVDQSLHQAMQKNPIAVGAAAVAAGVIVGMALPRTRREDALMGSVRDDLLDKAKGAAEEAMGSALGSAKQLAHQGIQEAKASIESAAGSHEATR